MTAATSREQSVAGVFQAGLEDVKDRLTEAQEVVTDRSGEAVTNAEKYVGDHPWKSLAVVGSIGVVIGMLIARR